MTASFFWLAALLQTATPPPVSGYGRDEIVTNLDAMIAASDRNGDGRLDLNEWRLVTQRILPNLDPVTNGRWSLRDFTYYDRDRNGVVTSAELAAPSLANFDCMDTNHDRRLTAAEQAAAARSTCLTTRHFAD